MITIVRQLPDGRTVTWNWPIPAATSSVEAFRKLAERAVDLKFVGPPAGLWHYEVENRVLRAKMKRGGQ